MRHLLNESSAVALLGSRGFAEGVTPRSKRPVFVVGCPRSGTTLLYHMLLSSGGFVVHTTETHVFNRIGPAFGNLTTHRNREKLLEQWRQSTYFGQADLDPAEIESRVLNECKNAADLLKIVMETLARKQKVERWAEKTPEHVLYVNEIKRTLPDALVIHIIRDGRDVALSLETQNWIHAFPWEKHYNLLVCALYWEWMVEAGISVGPILGPDYLEVRFEDLLDKPREALSRVGQFIDHDLDYGRIQQVGIGAVKKPNTSFDKKPDGSRFNPISRWGKGLPPKELARLEALVGSILIRLGYHLATSEDELPHTLELRRIRAFYRAYFSLRLWTKSHVPLASFLVGANASNVKTGGRRQA